MIKESHSHLPKPEPYQRLGSGDGERKTLLTRQIAFEPLPASVLFGLLFAGFLVMTAAESGGSASSCRSVAVHRAPLLAIRDVIGHTPQGCEHDR